MKLTIHLNNADDLWICPTLKYVLDQHTKQELLTLARACNLPLSKEGNRTKATLVQILIDNYYKLSLTLEVEVSHLPQQTELDLAHTTRYNWSKFNL